MFIGYMSSYWTVAMVFNNTIIFMSFTVKALVGTEGCSNWNASFLINNNR